MAFCRNCGAEVDDRAATCPTCGQPRTVSPSPVAPLASPPAAMPPPPPNVGFVASLLDFSFTSFVTTKLIKVIYALSMVIAVLGALILMAVGFRMGGALGVLMALVFTPVMLLLNIISARVVLEVLIVLFRMAEHTAEIARQGRRAAPL